MGAFYCAICRQTDFSGKGHIFGKSHQAKLKVVLVKFLEKVSNVLAKIYVRLLKTREVRYALTDRHKSTCLVSISC